MFKIRDPIVKIQMTALAAGFSGIMVASYGNAVLGQVPTSIMIYVSMALMLDPMRFDKDPNNQSSPVKEVSDKIT